MTDTPEAKAAAELSKTNWSHYSADESLIPKIIMKANAAHYLPLLRSACIQCSKAYLRPGCTGQCDVDSEIARLEKGSK